MINHDIIIVSALVMVVLSAYHVAIKKKFSIIKTKWMGHGLYNIKDKMRKHIIFVCILLLDSKFSDNEQ